MSGCQVPTCLDTDQVFNKIRVQNYEIHIYIAYIVSKYLVMLFLIEKRIMKLPLVIE